MTTTLKDRLSRLIGINTGSIPIRRPKGIEEIKCLRICISTLRQAEIDYLSPDTPQEDRYQAEQYLFGIHHSHLPAVCRVLGIDCHAARMALVEWKMKGLIGDPIFDYLVKPESMDRHEKGQEVKIPTLRDGDYGQEKEHDHI